MSKFQHTEAADATAPSDAASGRFVMEPLAEVAPSVKHPVFGKTMRELLSEL